MVVPEQLSSNTCQFGIQVTPNWFCAGTAWGQVDSVRIDSLRFTGEAEVWSLGDTLDFREISPVGNWIRAQQTKPGKQKKPMYALIGGVNQNQSEMKDEKE